MAGRERATGFCVAAGGCARRGRLLAHGLFLLHQNEGTDHGRPQGRVGRQPVLRLLVRDLGELAGRHPLADAGLSSCEMRTATSTRSSVSATHTTVPAAKCLTSSVHGRRAVSRLILRRSSVSFSGLVCIREGRGGVVRKARMLTDLADSRRSGASPAPSSAITVCMIYIVYIISIKGSGLPLQLRRYASPLRTLPTSAGRKQARLVPPARRTLGKITPIDPASSSHAASCCECT